MERQEEKISSLINELNEDEDDLLSLWNNEA